MPSNSCTGNSSNLLPNSLSVQSQIGIMNPQFSVPFYNYNTHLSNGNVVPMHNMPPTVTAPGFMNVHNHLLPLKNSHMGMPHLGLGGAMPHSGQCHVGFGAQNSVHSQNNLSAFPVRGPFCNLAQNVNHFNPSQPRGQLFAYNSPNLPQNFNQNIGVPNGQFCWQNQMQNMNQLVPMQMSNPTQGGAYNVSSCSHHNLGCPNQVAQARGPQDLASNANPQFGLVHSSEAGQHINQNQQKLVQPSMNVNASDHSSIATQQLQGNSSTSFTSHSVQLQQTQKNLQPSVFTGSQGNHVNGGNNISNSNWKNSFSKNFTRNPQRETLHRGFQKSQFHHKKNAKRKFGGFNENLEKGPHKDKAGKSGLADSSYRASGQQKRALPLNYTEREIQQWREERRKNYPSKANIEKKLTEKLTNSEVIDREAKLRREKLKEILAKQAELGVEVAELPSHYLSDSENRVHVREEDKWALTKKERFQNKYNKRGRRNRKDRFAKKQKFADNDSSNMSSLNTQKPTLLQKLLSADIRREKSHLLQAFRFMVMNSFFKDWPEKSLKFPLVIVKESAEVGEEKSLFMGKNASEAIDRTLVEEKTLLMERGVLEATDRTSVEEFDEDGDSDYENDENDARVEEKPYLASGNVTIGLVLTNSKEEDEEEGEIID